MKYLRISAVLIMLLAVNLTAQTTFTASKNNRNQATFVSDAPLENIVGVSNNIEAMAMIDLSNPSKMAHGKVKVDLRELKTGIEMRDEHLNSKMWLNTAEYPYATFKLAKISGVGGALEVGQKTAVKLHGTFSVHGKSSEVVAPATITYYRESEKTAKVLPGNLLKVNAEFTIKLADYGVEIPDMVVGKVVDDITVSANFVASDEGGNSMMAGCNPCGADKAKMGKCNPCSAKKAKCNPCGVK